jgi:hypothetical protein
VDFLLPLTFATQAVSRKLRETPAGWPKNVTADFMDPNCEKILSGFNAAPDPAPHQRAQIQHAFISVIELEFDDAEHHRFDALDQWKSCVS